MRTTSGAIATRLALAGGVVAGALAGTRHVTGRPLDALTSAACVAHLPGSTARCESDRFVAHTGPFIGPAIVGGIAGLVVAIVLVMLVGTVLRALTTNGRTAVVSGGAPAWTISPLESGHGRRCIGCGRRLDVGAARSSGTRCAACGPR